MKDLMSRQVKHSNTNVENIDVIALKLEYIQSDIKDIKGKLDNDFVTQDQFNPIQKVVYGLVTMTLLAVAGALIALVIK